MCDAKSHVRVPLKADMCGALAHVRYGPIADITSFDNFVGDLLEMYRHVEA
jgi:hypothetical protein